MVNDIRNSEYLVLANDPLLDYSAVKEWFGLQPNEPDLKTRVSIDAVSKAIRDYTGRQISKGQYIENFRDVREEKNLRFLRETPIDKADIAVYNEHGPTLIGPQPLTILNTQTGLVRLLAGPVVNVIYDGGYDPIPADLTIVFMELLRAQMAMLGQDLGNAMPVTAPKEKAIWVGTLKVEYAVSATSELAKAAGAGGITAAALTPWSEILDSYRSASRLVAT